MNKGFKLLGIVTILVILPVTVILALKTQTINQHASSNPCVYPITFFDGNFLKTSGTGLTYMNQRVCLYGATIYTSSGPGAPSGSWTNANFSQRIDWDLQVAQKAHINILRVTDFINNPSDNPYNQTVWKNMDYLISQAQTKGIFILMDLSSYANHLKNQNINPYDAQQYVGWQQFISFVINRVNSYTNLTYKDTPNIAFYSIKGEVNPVGSSFPSCSSSQCYLDFYATTTNAVFSEDGGNHLIEAGGLTHLNQSNSGIPWQQIFALPHVDIAAIHVYSANRLDPINGSNDLNVTLPMVANWAHQNSKPLDIQEYGLVNQLGDSQRSQAMQTIISRAINYGVTSIIYWNLGPETTFGMHYDVNPNSSYDPLTWQAFVSGAAAWYGSIFSQPSASPPTETMPTISSVPTSISGSKNDTITFNILDSRVKGWKVMTNLQSGNVQYADRKYTFTNIPHQLTGATWIQTTNDSKTSKVNPLVTIALNSGSTIYVIWDTRSKVQDWLKDWTLTELKVTDSDYQSKGFVVYKKTVSPGQQVFLGSTAGVFNGCSMYTIAVE